MKKVYVLQTKLLNDKDYTLVAIYENKDDVVKKLLSEGLEFYKHVDDDGVNCEADYYIDKLIVAQVRPMNVL